LFPQKNFYVFSEKSCVQVLLLIFFPRISVFPYPFLLFPHFSRLSLRMFFIRSLYLSLSFYTNTFSSSIKASMEKFQGSCAKERHVKNKKRGKKEDHYSLTTQNPFFPFLPLSLSPSCKNRWSSEP